MSKIGCPIDNAVLVALKLKPHHFILIYSNKYKEYLLPFFKYFFGENVNIIFHILKHSVK